jgi:hypothetical protein
LRLSLEGAKNWAEFSFGVIAPMELSETEKKMVARLRKKQEQMVRWRWWLIVVGLLCLAVSGYGLWMLLHFRHEPNLISGLMIAMFLPQIYLCLLFGAWMIGYAWANWHGNAQDRLLLRLIDEKRDPCPAQQPENRIP